MLFFRHTACSFLFFTLLISSAFGADTSAPPHAPGITVTAVGDIMPSTCFPSLDYLSTIPDQRFIKTMRAILGNADIRFGNLEGTIAEDAPCLKSCAKPSSCYAFNIPKDYAPILKGAGFNLFSIANNHISDFGEPGRRSTVRHLEANDIASGGTQEKPWDIIYANGLYIGFTAFAPHKGVENLLNRKAAIRGVQKLDAICDIVIVSMHGGAEGNGASHVPREQEFYLGENRGDLYDFAHAMVDAGADLVLGHGPHVVRGVELYKDRLIAYSLGNFFTWARFNLEGPKGLAPVLDVSMGPHGHFKSGRIRSYKQPYRALPKLDPDHAAAREAALLSQQDFPQNPLHISPDGILSTPST